MKEVDIKICLKRKNKTKTKPKSIKTFCLFFVTWYKIEQKALIFGEGCINKNAFH